LDIAQRLEAGFCGLSRARGYLPRSGPALLSCRQSWGRPDINFWVSDDLITWKKFGDYVPDLKRIPNYPKALMRIGAPKVFFDEASAQIVLTWDTTHDLGKTDVPDPYWAGQRKMYATSKDLKTFSEPPRRLFEWEMATIDTLIRREGERYYAIIKDERYRNILASRMVFPWRHI